MATSALCAVLLAVAMATASAAGLTRSEYRDCRDAGGSPEDQLACMDGETSTSFNDQLPQKESYLI